MKFTLSWLKTHLETTATTDEIAARLTALGLEVEEVEDPAAKLSGLIVGYVAEAVQHPNADRLRLCKVETGTKTLQVVCGAPNARAGIKVALALPGTIIPTTGEPLKAGSIRGMESQGMMCSARELGLGEDHAGIIELPESAKVGAPLPTALDLDPTITIAVTPNRGDCLGVRGIARDLAAAGVGTLKRIAVTPVTGTYASPVTVSLDFPPEAADACPLFAGRTIRGLKNGESPEWLKARLVSVGLRPISALVDITNFFTLDLNRPLHVFDVAKLHGNLYARLGRPGETLAALNGKSYDLDPDMTVIADDAAALALGGVIGGEDTGVSADTTTIFLESAYFDPARTGRTGRRLMAKSDARHRFERGIDPGFTVDGMELATLLILEICGGEASTPVIVGRAPAPTPAICFRPARVAQLGGASPGDAAAFRILEALGCAMDSARSTADTWTVSPPSWRSDLGAEHDLVEEVLRVTGFDAIPVVPLPRASQPVAAFSLDQRRSLWVRRALAARGLVESVTWSFVSAAQASKFGGGQDELRLANPIAAELDIMRPSPLPGLLLAASRNAARGMADSVLFEVGPGFVNDTPKGQRPMAVGLRWGNAASRQWNGPARAADAFDAKADLLAAIAAAFADGRAPDAIVTTAEAPAWYHPGRSGSLKLGNNVLGRFGALHPAILKEFDLDGGAVAFELFLDALPPVKRRIARPMLKASPFQPVQRDFAFLLDGTVAAETVLRAAKGADRALITDVAVFDLYAGKELAGKKSLAIQVTLQPTEKTLSDAEIDAVAAKIVAAVTKATGGTLRS